LHIFINFMPTTGIFLVMIGQKKTGFYGHNILILESYDTFYIVVDWLNTPLIILNIFLAMTAVHYVAFTTTSVYLLQKSVVNIMLATFLINILFTTFNLGLFYIAFELLMIPLFFLIGLGSRLRRLRAVTLFVMYTTLFSFVMLFGLIYT